MITRSILFALGIVVLSSLQMACGKKSGPTIQSIQFGSFTVLSKDRVELVPAREFSRASGASFGWISFIKPYDGKVRFREELTLPPGARTPMAPFPKDVSITTIGQTVITEGEIDVGGKVMGRSIWGLESEDALGNYSLRLFINGQFQQEYSFTVNP